MQDKTVEQIYEASLFIQALLKEVINSPDQRFIIVTRPGKEPRDKMFETMNIADWYANSEKAEYVRVHESIMKALEKSVPIQQIFDEVNRTVMISIGISHDLAESQILDYAIETIDPAIEATLEQYIIHFFWNVRAALGQLINFIYVELQAVQKIFNGTLVGVTLQQYMLKVASLLDHNIRALLTESTLHIESERAINFLSTIAYKVLRSDRQIFEFSQKLIAITNYVLFFETNCDSDKIDFLLCKCIHPYIDSLVIL